MARKKKERRKIEDWIDYEYEIDYTFECPVRGTVTQKVKVKRLKTRLVEEKHAIRIEGDELISYSDDIEYCHED